MNKAGLQIDKAKQYIDNNDGDFNNNNDLVTTATVFAIMMMRSNK